MPAWTLLLDTKGIVKNIWVGSMRLGHSPNSGLAQLEQDRSALPGIESVPYYKASVGPLRSPEHLAASKRMTEYCGVDVEVVK
jgi:hypothetical protein